jgi:hypothetical protein
MGADVAPVSTIRAQNSLPPLLFERLNIARFEELNNLPIPMPRSNANLLEQYNFNDRTFCPLIFIHPNLCLILHVKSYTASKWPGVKFQR